MRRKRTLDVDMCRHRQRVHARVGPSRSRERRRFASHLFKRFFERLLNRRSMILSLPAHERTAIILDRQPPTGHGSIVPFGIGKPRSSSPGVITPRPAR